MARSPPPASCEQFLYATGNDLGGIKRITHDGTEVASYDDPEKAIIYPVLGPGGLLFCVLFDGDHPEQDEIIALDAQTLQPRYRFGLSLLSDARRMAVVGEELFVCDTGNDRLQVFSLAGEHRRSITGEWKRPLALCLVKDRLYLVEEAEEERDQDFSLDEDFSFELLYPTQGRRIFVMSLQGDTLQVYTHPVQVQTFSEVLCCFDGKLLAPVRRWREPYNFIEMVALHGV